MILRVPVPEGWTSTVQRDGVLHERGTTSIRALKIRDLPADSAHWIQRTALHGAPAGTVWTLTSKAELRTIDGWPAFLSEFALDHTTFKKVRLVVLYQFLDYASGAIANVEPGELAAQRAELLDLLGRARPEWGPQDMTCLSRMFGDAASRLVTLR